MKNKWLRNACFYEIYPSSFYDSNGDGFGDLPGITEKLAYVKDLGCNGVWLNPCFCSEFRDGGYDITNYRRIDPRFGTNEDMDRLLAEAERLNVKVLMDLVVGHTSDRHPWFLESQKRERNRYSDYYIWTDNVFVNGEDCRTVNGVSERDGGYAINFFEFQPALNFGFYRPTQRWQTDYRSDDTLPLRDEIAGIIEFWLERGVSGFRVDIANSLVKGDEGGVGNGFVWNYILGKVRKRYPDAIFLSEWSNPEQAVNLAGFDMDFLLHSTDEYNSLLRYEPGTNILYRFERGNSYFRKEGSGDVRPFLSYYCRQLEKTRQNGYIAVPSGNHDLPRVSVGRDEADLKVFFAFLLTMPTVPFVYYGDEIGMRRLAVPNRDGGYNRTGSRTPMLWSGAANAGFSAAPPEQLYLPVEGRRGESVAEQLARQDSLLNTVKALLALRRSLPELSADADFSVSVCEGEGYPLVYRRGRLNVALNPSTFSRKICATPEKILLAENAVKANGNIELGGRSFCIYR